MVRCHSRGFYGKLTGTRVLGYLGPKVVGEYKAFLLPVTGSSEPGNTRAYPGNWQKSNTSNACLMHLASGLSTPHVLLTGSYCVYVPGTRTGCVVTYLLV